MCRVIGVRGVFLIVAIASTSSPAQVNSWINPASGNWDDATSWSLGVLPGSSQSVMITNTNWKAVAINPSTLTNFPGSMTVSNLTVMGSTNTENTLLLNYFGTAVPLTVLNGITLQDEGRILNFDSGLMVQGGTVVVTNTQMIQDGGLVLSTNAEIHLSYAEYDITNGVLESATVRVGWPFSSTFNQYGGTVLITNLVLGPGNPGDLPPGSCGGGYALYGGNLSLPGGLTLQDPNNTVTSYLQDGGTNQTTQVYIEPGIFGNSPSFVLNGGLLTDNDVHIFADDFSYASIEQNGGMHSVSGNLLVSGGASATGGAPFPATYRLNGGLLSATSMTLDSGSGPGALIIQSNAIAVAGEFQASSGSYEGYFTNEVDLYSGTLSCSNLFISDGGVINQNGGALTVSNTLTLVGYVQTPGPRLYTGYEFSVGTLFASNINVGGQWFIGDGTTNRISNPGICSLSLALVISNAVEQLGRFILASNAIIDLAGSASRLSFANSSGETWAGAATLLILDWNGNPSGGGAEQLKFGADQSGLRAGQLSQIEFEIGSNLYSATILSTGEVVPGQLIEPSVAFSRQGNNLILSWPTGWSLQSATNVFGPWLDVTNASSPYTNDMRLAQERFFRLRQ